MHRHQLFCDQLRKGVKLPFPTKLQRILETEGNSKGFEDEFRRGIQEGRLEQLRRFMRHDGGTPASVEHEKHSNCPSDNNVIIKAPIHQINALGDKRALDIVPELQDGTSAKDAGCQTTYN